MSLILIPTEGEIHFDGIPIKNDRKSLLAARRSMTMVFQNPYLFNMSVANNISYGLRSKGILRKDRQVRIKEALHLVGLDGFEKRRARELSGGEIQLVALARAFALNPLVLFLDEPTANVDPQHICQFEDVILKINRQIGTTIVMTTHNLSQAYRFTEHVFSLFNGSLVDSAMHNLFSGKTKETKEGPLFVSKKITLWISPQTYNPLSTHVTINPEDIILSKEPFSSSARNRFEGIITQIISQGGRALLEVRSQELFKVYITEKSLHEMKLNIGSKVYLTFKASSTCLL